MNADVVLSGYDRKTEVLGTLAVVPARLVGSAREIAGVPATDPGILGVYPLTSAQAERIARFAGAELDLDRYEYCLEAIARDARVPACRSQASAHAFG